MDVTDMHRQHEHQKSYGVSEEKKISGKGIKCDEQAYFLPVPSHFTLKIMGAGECMLGNFISKNNF